MDLSELRREYETAGLNEDDIAPDPIEQFDRWFNTAVESGIELPNTAALATADLGAFPSVRAVLVKGYDWAGFVFYTNYESVKGRDLASNPEAAMCLVWQPLHRQVRIQGIVLKTTPEESDEYFASRPRGAQVAAAASAQSAVMGSRSELDETVAAIEQAAGDGPVTRPPQWGGYRLVPHVVEFWQGRQNRLHDRLRYRRDDKDWIVERLAP